MYNIILALHHMSYHTNHINKCIYTAYRVHAQTKYSTCELYKLKSVYNTRHVSPASSAQAVKMSVPAGVVGVCALMYS